MPAPGQIDTCDPQLLRETRRVADAHDLPIQVHAGQSPKEYKRIRSEYGTSTVEYMSDAGLLGPDCLIGHGQTMTADGNLASLSPNEVAALRDSRTAVVHLPWVKARTGGVINSIKKYRQLGIRQSLGTDARLQSADSPGRWTGARHDRLRRGLGAMSGRMLGATSIGAPPVILYLSSGPDPVAITRANLTLDVAVI